MKSEVILLVDIEGHRERAPLMSALAALERRTEYLRVLGSYPRADDPLAPPSRPDAVAARPVNPPARR